ncbi:MAG: caspase family protein [Vicinamibacterales bacterium]
MPKGLSIHIGVNHVDPAHYEGWDGRLAACEADARDMQALARKQRFEPMALLLSEQATASALTTTLRAASKALVAGDLLLLTYSGHGGQVKDTNHDEKDHMDETWVLFDRQFIDDELYALWATFKAGVRILVLSDSCHSGTVSRDVPPFVDGGPRRKAMPRAVGDMVERAHRALYRDIQRALPGAERTKVRATVLLISGCMDNQFSMDGERNGAFTAALKATWKGGRFRGDYRRFHDVILASMDPSQSPNYLVVGSPNAAFESQKPFTI